MNPFKKRKKDSINKVEIPDLLNPSFDSEERINRSVFSTINLTRSQKLKPNAFQSPKGFDEVSVNRFEYTSSNFCKKIAKPIENPSVKKLFFGFGIHNHKDIISSGADIIYSPITSGEIINVFHSDIKTGFVVEKGEQPPSRLTEIRRNLADSCRLYVDADPRGEEWKGNNKEDLV